MIAILGTVFGLLGSLLPEILKTWRQKSDQLHEREMYKLQMEGMKLQGDIKLSEINAMADIEETKAVYAHATIGRTGWKFVDGLISLYTGSVRPTVTYAFMATYVLVKYAIYVSYTHAGYQWTQAVAAVWSSEDFAVFSTIMAFWFGGRFMKYAFNRIK